MKYKNKYFVVAAGFLLSFIVLAFYVINSLSVSVKSNKISFTNDEFVEIQATLKNNTFFPLPTFWGSCGESYDIFVDEKNVESFRGLCFIGPQLLLGGEKRERTFLIDMSAAKSRKHTFYFVFDGRRSNKIHFETVDESTIPDCYNYVDAITPSCKQILIHTNIFSASSEENNARCLRIKDRFITNTFLKPIPSRSTINCDTGQTAYFVMNVPEDDYEAVKAALFNTGYHAEIFTSWTHLDIIEVTSN